MQYVNDDMDDLFRRAAENYPLDTKSADWDKIAAELEIQPVKPKDHIFKDRRYLWLLLLLPISFLCNHIFNSGTLERDKLSEAEFPGKLKHSKTNLPGNNKLFNPGNIDIVSNQNEINNFNNHNNISQKLSVQNVIISGQKIKTSPNEKESILNNNIPSSSITLYLGPEKLQSLLYSENFTRQIKREAFGISSNYRVPALNILYASFHPVVKEIIFKIPEQEKRNKHALYAGIIGSVDATSIKFQKISNAGYSFGMLLGIKLNNRWNIESGIFHDKKYYYSQGQYLNTSKMYILPGTKINSLDGNCSMWEIPLQARYNFNSTKNKIWFSTLGLSSYFMKKENYEYTYSFTSTGQTYDKYRSYNNASKHFFSVITFSTGVTKPLNKTIDLRIEPYLKIPVKGVGVGSLSLQSAGVQVGITKTIF
jgi:hypothetical protein